MKTCKKGLHTYSSTLRKCPECKKQSAKLWMAANYDKMKVKRNRQSLQWYYKNRDRAQQTSRQWKKVNKDQVNLLKRQYYHNCIKTDSDRYFVMRVRSLLRDAFRRKGYNKQGTVEMLVGCDFKTLQQHLEETWRLNYGTVYNGEPIHIDHKIPLACATTEDEVLRLSLYTNLQYLKPEDNLLKSDKLDWAVPRTTNQLDDEIWAPVRKALGAEPTERSSGGE